MERAQALEAKNTPSHNARSNMPDLQSEPTDLNKATDLCKKYKIIHSWGEHEQTRWLRTQNTKAQTVTESDSIEKHM